MGSQSELIQQEEDMLEVGITMSVFQNIVRAVRKIKADMRVKNTDQIRVDAYLQLEPLMTLHIESISFQEDIARMCRIDLFSCPAWEYERPSSEDVCFIGRIDIPEGYVVASCTEEVLGELLARFPCKAN